MNADGSRTDHEAGETQVDDLLQSLGAVLRRARDGELVDQLVDFTMRAKPLLDWGRAIEGRLVAT